MIRRPGQLLVAAACLAAGAVVAGTTNSAMAQEGPLVVSTREKPPTFSLYDVRAAADVVWRFRNEKQDPRGPGSSTFTENHFEETFTIESNGHIYHPNLVDLRLAGTFGLSQTFTESDVDDNADYGIVDEYDLNATFLRKETAPVTVYTRRIQDLVNREFGPTLDNTITTHGAIWNIRWKDLPTRFEVFHSEQTQEGIADDVGDFKLTQDTFLWHSEARPFEGHTITWDFTLSDVSEETEGFASNDYLVQEANLSWSIDFGKDDRNNLTTSVSYFDQSGDFPIERFRLDEFLRLRHSDNFDTRYQYTYDQQSFSGIDQERHRGTAGFTHRLYKSLVTSGTAGVEQIDRSDDSASFEYFGNLSFDYRKDVPLGVFSALLGFGYSRQDNEQQGSPIPVVNAPRTFTDGIPIIITGPNVDPDSLVITDSAGLVVFQPGFDYRVDEFADRLEIDRIIGGRIPGGSTVLVDYLLLPQAENVTTTSSFALGGRYDIDEGTFKGLSLYGRYTKQDQEVDTEDPEAFTPNSFDDIRLGAEYRYKDWLFGVEHQRHDATIAPYNANRLFARYLKRLSSQTILNLNANYTMIEQTDIDNDVNLLAVSATVQYRVSRNLYLNGTVLWREEEDDLRGHTRGIEEQLELNWRHRQTTVYGLIRNSNLMTDFQDNSFQYLEIGIRREF